MRLVFGFTLSAYLVLIACDQAGSIRQSIDPAPPAAPVQAPTSPLTASSTPANPTLAQMTADRLATLFGLTSLSQGGADELRVWSVEYVFGNTQGIIVTPHQITVHWVQDTEPRRPRRLGVRETAQPSPVFSQMDYFAALNNAEWFCAVVDGGALFIEGLHNGKRFTFSASNAEVCEADKMKQLNEALALIGDLPEPR